MRICLIVLALFVPAAVPATVGAQGDVRPASYYHPPVVDSETYKSPARVLDEASRPSRLKFIAAIEGRLLAAPYPPQVVLFTNGLDAEHLIIVANSDGRLSTKYRVRAMFATLTTIFRQTPLFRDYGVETEFTFFDLAKLSGFQTVTVTDGRDYTYQVVVE